ncbi:NAD(P)H-dependent oxidoreductase [Candidatus Nomurabacteria bacterium]|nr:NAD(P)H-dependent oxidoreductase [Candidatus Nomurabacteria bacterium]
MKVITLSCSPSRKRNSDTMLDNFISGMREYSKDLEIEKIYLEDVPIKLYRFENRLGPESNESAFRNLTDKIMGADGLVIATPTYNFGVPAHLKNFIDRIRFFALDFDNQTILNQPKGMLDYLKTYYIVSGGTPSWAQKILFFAFPPFWLRSVFLYYGADCMGALYTGNVRAFENQRILNICHKRGKKFAKHLINKKQQALPERIFWRPPQVD